MSKLSAPQAIFLRTMVQESLALCFADNDLPRFRRLTLVYTDAERKGRYRDTDGFKFETARVLINKHVLERIPLAEVVETVTGQRSPEMMYRVSKWGMQVYGRLKDEDFVLAERAPRVGLTDAEKTREIMQALRARYDQKGTEFYPPEWVFFEEVSVATGFASKRMDAWAVNCYPSKSELRGFEVKVSRGDFLKELKDPNKRKHAMSLCDRFYFVTPRGLIKLNELPAGCGLIEWTGRVLRTVVQPQDANLKVLPVWFVMSLARRVRKREVRVGAVSAPKGDGK